MEVRKSVRRLELSSTPREGAVSRTQDLVERWQGGIAQNTMKKPLSSCDMAAHTVRAWGGRMSTYNNHQPKHMGQYISKKVIRLLVMLLGANNGSYKESCGCAPLAPSNFVLFSWATLVLNKYKEKP